MFNPLFAFKYQHYEPAEHKEYVIVGQARCYLRTNTLNLQACNHYN